MENLDYTNSFKKEQMFRVREILVKMPEIKKKTCKSLFYAKLFFLSENQQLPSIGKHGK